MKNSAILFVGALASMVTCTSANAASGVRITYNPRNLNQAWYEIDVIEQCHDKLSCSVEVTPGKFVKITGSGTNEFDRKNDFSPSGLVSQHMESAKLPANPCVESPFPITNAFWRPDFKNRDRYPTGWNPANQRFEASKVGHGFSFIEIPGKPSRFCISPTGKDAGAFSVLSLRLEVDLAAAGTEIAFADTMKRASQTFSDRVEEAVNNARLLEDDEENLKTELVPQVRLLVSALTGLRVALSPAEGDALDFPSAADDYVRRAVYVALKAWEYVSPAVTSARVEEKNVSRAVKKDEKALAIAYAPRAFNRQIEWLAADMEAIREVYGEANRRDYGKSQFVVPLAELLLAELDRLRASVSTNYTSETAPAAAVLEWLKTNQETIVEICKAAREHGDEAPQIPALLAEYATTWNTDASQKLLKGLSETKAREDLRVYLAFFDSMRKLPIASKIEFKRVTIAAGTKARAGNGGAVKCTMDADGEYCYVDLLSQCEGRMACSTKLSFNGHWVAASSKTGMLKASSDLGGWVLGEQEPIVKAGSMLPSNTEVCSDLPITSVLYMPKNANDRWTSESGGVVRGRTPAQPSLETKYPPAKGYSPLNSKCVLFDAKMDEGAYVIKSVRVKVDLDKDRSKLMRALMINAARRLKGDLDDASKIARDHESILKDQGNGIREYRTAIEKLSGEIDKGLFSAVNVPVTLPEVRQAAANLYVRANLLLSQSKGHEIEAPGYVTSLRMMIAQLSLGFGLNRTLLGKTELVVEKAELRQSPEEVRKGLDDLARKAKPFQEVLPTRYRAAMDKYIADLSATASAVDSTPKDKKGYGVYVYAVAAQTQGSASQAVASAEAIMDLMQKYPARYRAVLDLLTSAQAYLRDTFRLPGGDAGKTKADDSHKLSPLFEVLYFSVDEGTRRLALKWSDPLYDSAYRIQLLLRDELLPIARSKGGDEEVAKDLPKLGQAWVAPEFQVFLNAVGGKASNSKTSEAQHLPAIVGQIQSTMNVDLKNLGLILPAQD